MKMPTDFAALDRLHPLPPRDLFRQWMLTRDPDAVPVGWTQHTRGGWHLSAHPDARVCELRTRGGAPIGWAVDPLVYLDGDRGVIPGDRLTLPVESQFTPSDLEAVLYGRDARGRTTGQGLEGPWTALVFGNSDGAPFVRVYLGATHSVMFSAESRVVATSHSLVPGVRRNEALSRAFDPLASRAYYTFGLTAFRNVRRLLPNHYLDLETFRPVRHWPLEPLDPLREGADGAAAIVDHARRMIGLLATEQRAFRVYLSAGRDSRSVLALLQPFLGDGGIDVDLSTSYGDDLASRTDLQGARRLARIAGLPHEERRRRPFRAADTDMMRAFVRIGEARGGKRLAAPRLAGPNPAAYRFDLGGMGGEVARSFFWNESVRDEPITPELVAKLTRLPITPEVVDAAAAWLSSLPAGVRERVADTMDLAYVEQRMGCWEFASRYLFPGPLKSTSPMATTHGIETMLRLPEAYRAAGRLQHDMVAYGWPELLEVPFNRPTGLLRVRTGFGDLQARIRRRLHSAG